MLSDMVSGAPETVPVPVVEMPADPDVPAGGGERVATPLAVLARRAGACDTGRAGPAGDAGGDPLAWAAPHPAAAKEMASAAVTSFGVVFMPASTTTGPRLVPLARRFPASAAQRKAISAPKAKPVAASHTTVGAFLAHWRRAVTN
jgi:hypothetical protein